MTETINIYRGRCECGAEHEAEVRVRTVPTIAPLGVWMGCKCTFPAKAIRLEHAGYYHRESSKSGGGQAGAEEAKPTTA